MAKRRPPPEIDPTANVIALVKALDRSYRQNRKSDRRFLNARLNHLSSEADLREGHARDLREAEAKRLDAIRQVDTQARDTAADRALTAIQTVATNVAETAETLRKSVAETAQALQKASSDIVAAQNSRITALEKTDAERSGKGAGVGLSWQVLLGAAGLLLSIAAMFKYG
jgi:hypothetical protein